MEDLPIGRTDDPPLAGCEPASRMENLLYDPFVSPEPPPAPLAPAPAPTPGPSSNAPRLSGPRRAIATAVLSVGLLALGGAAVVLAADPSPGTTTTPNATTAPANGGSGTAPSAPTTPGAPGTRPQHGQGAKGDCPNMGGSGSGSSGSGSSGSSNSTTPAPQSSADPSQL